MDREYKVKTKYFLLGLGFAMTVILLTAASNTPPAPNYGRYQISSWAGQLGPNGGGVGAFVVDTTSGETKTIYSRFYGDVEDSKIEKNNLKLPFSSMN